MYETLKVVAEFFASGIGVFVLTHVAKKLSFIPLAEGQTVKLRAFAGILSALGTVGVSMANGNVGVENLQAFVVAVSGFAFSWLTSHTVHKTLTAKN
jgi:hypothetical protein